MKTLWNDINQPVRESMPVWTHLEITPLIGPLTPNRHLTVIFKNDQALIFLIVSKNSLYFHPLPYGLFLHTIRATSFAKNRRKNIKTPFLFSILVWNGRLLIQPCDRASFKRSCDSDICWPPVALASTDQIRCLGVWECVRMIAVVINSGQPYSFRIRTRSAPNDAKVWCSRNL